MFTATDEKPKRTQHLGRKVQRVREIIGMKQTALADVTGMSQQNISKLEQSESMPEETLEKLAKGLGVTADFIKSFDEEKAVYNIQTNMTFNDQAANNGHQNYQATYNNNNNPLEKVAELFEKLLQSEREKVELLTNANKAIQDLVKQINELRGDKFNN
ncbi:transcriptional regulator with XRE-family HTH domain [Pontibacter ummariensis]|uniref:Transcriptional regulator, contains XRE-family HTH domain n=1 Tax=Pontibacter ummariensis TaxID=1610492 RepID=A0A239IEJ2_9BACT|nr:helix-turn-helix transcriptional regulator [Pontibacter ummariensis]PRY09811.1 transcriptional regulator with XRE-family HTH domain [Pontibacter ummariensis]SNS91959.1 Transcriptional regulator, contains XRE-family HTH domain [Pontibacter ummariensis]